ncbi:MAG: Ku protein [Gammaproteobacteria bacterium]|nr:MAG: Ku protein [Gammaproteobacteria bacterium]
MPKPIWKGYITFGLVNIPVVLYPAEKKCDIHLKLIDSRDQSRIRYVRVNENTHEEVPWDQVAKGYEYEEHHYLLLKAEEMKAIAGEKTKRINLEHFVDKNEVSSMGLDKPYYLVPRRRGNKEYVILREALKNTQKLGIAKVMIHTRQYLAAIMPYENALILNLMRYHQALRKPSEFELPADKIKPYKISAQELDNAKQLVVAMTIAWKPEEYHDEWREALQRWAENKRDNS